MILYIGSIYPKDLLDKLVERKQHVDFAAQTFQSSVLKGLDQHTDDIKVITSPVVRSKHCVVKDICSPCRFTHKSGEEKNDVYVGTTAIPGIQMLAEVVKVYKAAKKMLKTSEENKSLIVYALHTPFLIAALMLRHKTDRTCVIVPDLPEYMSSKRGRLKRMAKWVDKRIIDFCVKRLNCFVLLSPYMREKLPIADKPWTLMEGIFDEAKASDKVVQKCDKKVILYTGNLSERMGIVDLLEAFKTIEDSEYRLWIRGNGITVKQKILDAQKEDARIVYYEPMPKEQLRELQRKATILINPVKASNEFTKYFFPSKTMEYLASGTPTLMYKLPCLPEDYYEHIYFIEEETVEGLRKKIVEVCEKPNEEHATFGNSASEFIYTKKNAFVQTKKIIELLNDV